MLSTTSYAVLGMLAIRPWTAYELTKQMRRSLDHCWPKTESVLYDEPKRLARLGLATATQEPSASGGRSRTHYAITAEGERALGAWLATAPSPPRVESEALLRVLYADHGSVQDLLEALSTTRAALREQLRLGLAQVRDYRQDGGPFPDRLHISVLFADFVARILSAFDEWAAEAEAEVASWPDTRDLGATPETRRRLDEVIGRLESVLTQERTAD